MLIFQSIEFLIGIYLKNYIPASKHNSMKDNFSHDSGNYAKYRPQYPKELFQFIKSELHSHEKAWDCGTGNGQVAAELAQFMERVEATDISQNQIMNAQKKANILYSNQPAEKSSFNDKSFDLIIVAQAIHWFIFEQFYREVKRCLKPGGLFAVIGYGLFKSNAETNKIMQHFYNQIIGEYWDKERTYLDKNYRTIPFPFKEQQTPKFNQVYNWTIEHLLGYLRTWSAVEHYRKKHHKDPVAVIEPELRETFGASGKIEFPILFRLGKID